MSPKVNRILERCESFFLIKQVINYAVKISTIIRIVTKKKVSTRATPIKVKVQRSSWRPGNWAAACRKAAKMLLTAIAQLPKAPTDMA